MIYIIKMITEYVIFLYKVKVSLYREISKLKGNSQCKKKKLKYLCIKLTDKWQHQLSSNYLLQITNKQKFYGQVKSTQYFTVVPPSLIPYLAPQLPLLLSISGAPTEKTFKTDCLLS